MEIRLFFDEFYGINEQISEIQSPKEIQKILATHAHYAHRQIATKKSTEKFQLESVKK